MNAARKRARQCLNMAASFWGGWTPGRRLIDGDGLGDGGTHCRNAGLGDGKEPEAPYAPQRRSAAFQALFESPLTDLDTQRLQGRPGQPRRLPIARARRRADARHRQPKREGDLGLYWRCRTLGTCFHDTHMKRNYQQNGTPGGIRTPGPNLRKVVLLSTELRAYGKEKALIEGF